MERLNALVSEVNALPAPHGEFLGIAGDVTDVESLRIAVDETLERFGRLDILVANAGLGQRGPVADSPWEDLETLLRTNIDGVLHSVRLAVPAMRANGGGHVIIVSSIVWNMVSPYAASYAASKAFVSSMAHSLRFELMKENIHVTDVVVGRTATEFDEKRLGGQLTSSGRIPVMPPDQVAAAIMRAVERPRKTVYPRLLDRLAVWANVIVPDVIGRYAGRHYR
jgi:short-subunit dehydrogenase